MKKINQSDGAEKKPGNWDRLILWVRHHPSIARLVGISAGLVLFLALLPAYIRLVFWNGLMSNNLLAFMLIIFSLLAVSLVWSTSQRLDTWIFLILNIRGRRPYWLDRMMLGFTQLGNFFAILGVALLLYLASDRLLSYELIFGALTLWLLVELLKFLVHRSRPFIRLTQARIVGSQAIGRSFPSGHTSQAFFMATLISQHFQFSIWASLILYAIAFLVGITRMYVGAHYPRDVLAGAILGSAWGLLGAIAAGYARN